MPSRTPEQVAACEAMDAALAQLRVAYNRDDATEPVTAVGWVAVEYAVQIDGDGEVCMEQQDIYMSHGMMLPMAKGLFQLGVENVERAVGDD